MFNLYSCAAKREIFWLPFPYLSSFKTVQPRDFNFFPFVFGRFIFVLHSYPKHKPFKMLWEALFLFAFHLEVFLSPFVPVWQTASRLNFSLCPSAILLALATTGIRLLCSVLWCSLKWNLVLTKVDTLPSPRAKQKNLLHVFNWSKSSFIKNI